MLALFYPLGDEASNVFFLGSFFLDGILLMCPSDSCKDIVSNCVCVRERGITPKKKHQATILGCQASHAFVLVNYEIPVSNL